MIRKLNTLLAPKENSFISFEHINLKPDEWQALLETMIPDYLIDDVCWKENEMGIESNSHEIKINTIETTELATYPDCLNLPPVSDVVYNNAINCDLDEQI